MGRQPEIPYDEIPKMKFGRLKPIQMISEKGRTKWLCKCDCGKETVVTQKNLCNGNTKSCGCYNIDMLKSRKKEYDHNERLYVLWTGMKQRCNNQNNISYKWYGGKGIRVWPEWENNYLLFKKWAIETGYDETLPRGAQTIERKDHSKDYSPENCTWKTIQEQQRNKVNNTPYEMNGERHLLSEWAEILGVDYELLRSRVADYKWTLEQALREPYNSKINMEKKKIEYNGENLTIKEWSEKTGISEDLIRERTYYSNDPQFILNPEKNRRRDCTLLEYKGKEKLLSEWAKEFDIPYGRLKGRIKRGWSIERALETK